MQKILFLMAGLMLASCDAVRDDLYSVGGYPAVQMDRMLPAVTFQQHYDRYVLAIGFIGPVALYSAYDNDSLDDVVDHLSDVRQSLKTLHNALGECAYGITMDQCTDVDISKSVLSFETHSLKVQRDLMRVVGDLGGNLGQNIDINKGDLTSLSSLVKAVWGLRSQVKPARNAAAAFRDASHVYARNAAELCLDSTPRCKALKGSLKGLYDDGASVAQPTLMGEQAGERTLKRLLDQATYVLKGQNTTLLAAGTELIIGKQLRFTCERHGKTFADFDTQDCAKIALGVATAQ